MNLFKIPLTLTYQEVLPFLGMNKEPSPQEKELIEYYLKEIKQKAQPLGIWKTFSVKAWEPGKISLENSPLLLAGVNTSKHFKTCDHITLLGTTLGQEIDHLLAHLSPQNPAEALIADAVASTAIECFTEQLDLYLSTQIKRKGYFPTARFSPGYGDWSLHRQKEFLASIESEKIGLTATAYFLLQPMKSVTAALGWSKTPVPRSYDSPPAAEGFAKKPCCSAQTCPYCHLASSCPDRQK
ncbi:MAG: hypothetical protein PHS83_03105 [Clostridia bacterium]|jgi:hypothetical protein|nr:hypothetical protein [Clostridia bacterium]MDD4146077.1 hypothetical protein [Clostridia bacterium]MDD4665887.1 hypothetical protein [Clostridia bacterium]